MRIIVDTNIVISAVFFRGIPKEILKAVADKKFSVCANEEISSEYSGIVEEKLAKKNYVLDENLFQNFMNELEFVTPISDVKICRDHDDDKFINCAIDAKALYIVSGDKDLLTIGNYEGIEIIMARDFYNKYLNNV